MKKLKFLIKYGLKKRVYRKAFLIANIIIAILTIGIINLPTIINLFSPEEEIKPLEVYIINEIGEPDLITQLSTLLNPQDGEAIYNFSPLDISELDVESFWDENDKDIIIHFTGTVENTQIASYVKDPVEASPVFSVIQYVLIKYQIDDYVPAQFAEPVLPPDYESPEEQLGLSSLSSILVLPMFILITLATQFIGVDIIEEKSTKAIETIIASVPANIHFLSKIISSISFVAIQGGLVLIYGLIAGLIGGATSNMSGVNLPSGEQSLIQYLAEIMPNWPVVLVLSLLFMVVGTLVYLVVAALFASMAVTQEDYQQFQSPLMITLVAGFYIGIFAPMAGGYGFMKVMAFIPIFTPIVAPVALASGIMSTLEAIIALVIVILFLGIMLYIVTPVYRVAILSYDQTKFMKRVKDYFKKGFVKNGKNNK
ncbi:MAG: ABC transporter permease [Acholeplasmataceae bacterium]|jgi:ABC-2 type transport system permease protein|nr:ABC transporter permease [Acholeplasmataceae bacterium]